MHVYDPGMNPREIEHESNIVWVSGGCPGGSVRVLSVLTQDRTGLPLIGHGAECSTTGPAILGYAELTDAAVGEAGNHNFYRRTFLSLGGMDRGGGAVIASTIAPGVPGTQVRRQSTPEPTRIQKQGF